MLMERELRSKKSLTEKKELSTVKLVRDRLYINDHIYNLESYDRENSDCDPLTVEPIDYAGAVWAGTHYKNASIHIHLGPSAAKLGARQSDCTGFFNILSWNGNRSICR